VAAISKPFRRSRSPSRGSIPLYIARPLAAHVARRLRVGFVGVMLVDQEGLEAHGVYGETSGKPTGWWAETNVDLRGEPSGIARAYFDAAPVTVYDVAVSSLVSPRLATLVGAQSGAWVPMITEERVVGVLVLATIDEKREFAAEELSLLQAVAAEAPSRSSGSGPARRSPRPSTGNSALRRSCAAFEASSTPTVSCASHGKSSATPWRSTRSRSTYPAMTHVSTSSEHVR
jgi:hypothetical protein